MAGMSSVTQVTIEGRLYDIIERFEPGPNTKADAPNFDAFITVRLTTGKTTKCAFLYKDGSAKMFRMVG